VAQPDEHGRPTPSWANSGECLAGRNYHSRAALKDLDRRPSEIRIAEPQRRDFSR
jgi:hypothetical protein